MSTTPISRRELIAAGAPFIVERFGHPARNKQFPDAFSDQRVLVDPRGDGRHFDQVTFIGEQGQSKTMGLARMHTGFDVAGRKQFLAAHMDTMDDHAAAALRLVKDHGPILEHGFPRLNAQQIEASGVSKDAWLYAAATHGDETASTHYLKLGADPLRVTHDGSCAAKVLLQSDLGRVLNAHYGEAGIMAEAARRGSDATFEQLANAGGLAAHPPAMGEIAVHGSPRMVERALADGLDPNALDFGKTPALLRCIAESDPQTAPQKIQALLKAGADVHATDPAGNSALHLAAQRGYGECIEPIMSYGASPLARNAEGQTALHVAHPSCVLGLLQMASDPNAKDHDGRTALHHQVRTFDGSTLSAVESLVAFGANPNAQDRRGNSPLHEAAAVGNTPVMGPLLEAGADPKLTNAAGKPARVESLLGRDETAVQRVWQAGGHQLDFTRPRAVAASW